MISFKQKGDFKKFNSYLERLEEVIKMGKLNKYGEEGVSALASATPVDTGLTASSWQYKINRQKGSVSISFENTNVNNGECIAILLQYGHGTRNGGYVTGIDYINPAMRPIFDEIEQYVISEVSAK